MRRQLASFEGAKIAEAMRSAAGLDAWTGRNNAHELTRDEFRHTLALLVAEQSAERSAQSAERSAERSAAPSRA